MIKNISEHCQISWGMVTSRPTTACERLSWVGEISQAVTDDNSSTHLLFKEQGMLNFERDSCI
jgi:hypothetical protein